jgi:hypothetical protein
MVVMPSAFVISTPQFVAGFLLSQRRGLRFEASDTKTSSLHDRVFPTPEAAQQAVERLITGKITESSERIDVSCRPLF